MSNEDIKDLLQMIKTCSKNLDSKLTFDSGCCKCLLEYIDGLKERIEYLERSNDRREDTIRAEREENLELHNKIDKVIEYLKDRIQVLEVSYSYDKNDEYLNAKLFGGKKELEMLLNEVLKESDVDE